MQIFILDNDIKENVKHYADKHVVKILTEVCQIISTVARQRGLKNDILYNETHSNHPCVKWCRESLSNYEYCVTLARALYEEYQYRYNKPDKHLRAKAIIEYTSSVLPVLDMKGLTPFAQAMPDEYRKPDAVQAYREYYRKEKSHLFNWTKRPKPDWI